MRSIFPFELSLPLEKDTGENFSPMDPISAGQGRAQLHQLGLGSFRRSIFEPARPRDPSGGTLVQGLGCHGIFAACEVDPGEGTYGAPRVVIGSAVGMA